MRLDRYVVQPAFISSRLTSRKGSFATVYRGFHRVSMTQLTYMPWPGLCHLATTAALTTPLLGLCCPESSGIGRPTLCLCGYMLITLLGYSRYSRDQDSISHHSYP